MAAPRYLSVSDLLPAESSSTISEPLLARVLSKTRWVVVCLFVLALLLSGQLAIFKRIEGHALLRRSHLKPPFEWKQEIGCDQTKEDVVYWTKASLTAKDDVTSAEDCRSLCHDAPGCGAWTWGREPGMSGVTHVCFLKKLEVNEFISEEIKLGVVSGLVCQGQQRSSQGDLVQRNNRETTQIGQDRLDCGFNTDVDYVTSQMLKTEQHVSSADICRATCRAAPGCAAWTWGKARGIADLTDICFLKRAEEGEHSARVPKIGVISGLDCLTVDTAAHSMIVPPSAITSPFTSRSLSTTTIVTTTSTSPARKKRVVPAIQTVVKASYSSLFCFSLMRSRFDELGLLTMQRKKKVSIFACDEYAVYSNESTEEAGFETSAVNMSFNLKTGNESARASSTEIFHAIWSRVVSAGRFKLHDWTVKVEPDCVFFPSRLRSILIGYSKLSLDLPHGMYLNNCINGLQSPVEVLSRMAVEVLGSGWQRCLEHFQWLCSGSCGWGEDLFIDQCLSGVLKVDREYEMGLLIEEHCEPPLEWKSCHSAAAAFHPFSKVDAYEDCISAAESVSGTQHFQ